MRCRLLLLTEHLTMSGLAMTGVAGATPEASTRMECSALPRVPSCSSHTNAAHSSTPSFAHTHQTAKLESNAITDSCLPDEC